MVKYNSTENVFIGDFIGVLKLAMRAIQSMNYKIDDANENLGFITFSTGMTWNSFAGASCTLSLEETGEGKVKVSGAGKQKPAGIFRMSIDLTGEANGIANKVILRMQEMANVEK